jgi:hypothetical protein
MAIFLAHSRAAETIARTMLWGGRWCAGREGAISWRGTPSGPFVLRLTETQHEWAARCRRRARSAGLPADGQALAIRASPMRSCASGAVQAWGRRQTRLIVGPADHRDLIGPADHRARPITGPDRSQGPINHGARPIMGTADHGADRPWSPTDHGARWARPIMEPDRPWGPGRPRGPMRPADHRARPTMEPDRPWGPTDHRA